MKQKKQDNITIDFTNASSVDDVTGSCIYVNYLDNHILLECGLSQGKSVLENYRENSKDFSFKVKDLQYIFVMHSHIDHQGLLPRLYAEGCKATIFVPENNKEIMYALLKNSAMILETEAKFLTKRDKKGKIYEPLYTKQDVELTMKFIKEIDFYKEVELNDDIKFKFISSGHVTMAGSLLLEIKKGQTYKKIYYTSDLGNTLYKNYYTNNLDKIKNADIVISECTYSTKEQSTNDKEHREKDKQKILSSIEQYDKVIFPVFSFARGQTMATILYELYKDKGLDRMIYMDSMLLSDITKIYERMFLDFKEVMSWDKIKVITKEDRDALQKSNEKMIVLCSSGFLNGGSSVSWVSSIIEKSNNCIVFCGYTGQGTLAGKIKDAKLKTITINGETYKNRAQITSLRSFSSHMQYNQLLEYLSDINCEKLILHHGNEDGKFLFKLDLEKEYEKQCKTTKVVIPNRSTKMRI